MTVDESVEVLVRLRVFWWSLRSGEGRREIAGLTNIAGAWLGRREIAGLTNKAGAWLSSLDGFAPQRQWWSFVTFGGGRYNDGTHGAEQQSYRGQVCVWLSDCVSVSLYFSYFSFYLLLEGAIYVWETCCILLTWESFAKHFLMKCRYFFGLMVLSQEK